MSQFPALWRYLLAKSIKGIACALLVVLRENACLPEKETKKRTCFTEMKQVSTTFDGFNEKEDMRY